MSTLEGGAHMAGVVRKAVRTGLLVVAPTLALCFAMLEVGLRLQGTRPSNATEGIFQKYGKTYRLRPNVTKLSRTPSYTCVIATNSFGLRDRTVGARSLGPAYFAFLGDSITFGNGVDYDDSFVGAFSRAASTRGIDVLNLAVGGHRFSDQETLFREFLAIAPRAPSSVVVVFTKEFITGFERDASGLIVKNGYLFSADRWVLPYVTVMMGDASSAYGFFRDGIRHLQGRVRTTTKEAADSYLTDFTRVGPWSDPALRHQFDARLGGIDRLIRDAGATPIYVYMPVARDLDADRYVQAAGRRAEEFDFRLFYDLLGQHASREAIRLVDLTPVLTAVHASGAVMTFMRDGHYNADANHAIADALAAALLKPTSHITVTGR